MGNYLIIENDTVLNVIVADSAELAAELTGKEVIELTDTTPWIGWTRSGDTWIEPVEEIIDVQETTLISELEESINDQSQN